MTACTTGRLGRGLPEPDSLAVRYEALRKAGLGEPVPPEDRTGLVIFLRRGMWGWARALAPSTTPQRSVRLPSASATPLKPRAAIQLLAAMAMNSNHGRR